MKMWYDNPQRASFSPPTKTTTMTAKTPLSVEPLLLFRKSVFDVVEKSREMALSLDISGEKLRSMKDRLPVLEAAMKPLHSQSLQAKLLEEKVDQALSSSTAVLRTFDTVRELQGVLQEERLGNVRLYLASLTQLEEAVEFLSLNFSTAVERITEAKDFLATTETADNYRIYKLKENLQQIVAGAGADRRWDAGLLKGAPVKLEALFRSLLLETAEPMVLKIEEEEELQVGDSAMDPLAPEPLPPAPRVLLPPHVITQLQMIVEWFKLHNNVDKLLDIYRDSRLTVIKRSLQTLNPHYLSNPSKFYLNKVEWSDLEIMIELWTFHIPVACKELFRAERKLCYRAFEKLEKEKWITCWGKLSREGFGPFLAFGEGVAESKSDPHKLFALLDMYKVMEELLPHIFEVFEGRDAGCEGVISRSRELLKTLSQRACQTIWDFGESVVSGHGDLPPNGDRSLLCSYVVNYVKCLVDGDLYAPTMAKILRTDKNTLWRGRETLSGENQDKPLSIAVIHMMRSLEKHLVKQAKSYEDPSLAAIFLGNSFKYMTTRSEGSEMGPLLGESWRNDMDQKLRELSTVYARKTWDTTLSYLVKDGLSPLTGTGSGRGSARDLARKRLTSFNLSFEETCRRHTKWVITDTDLKFEVREAVVQEIVPAYRSFIHAYRSLLEQGSSITRFVKFSPEDVDRMIRDLFELKTQEKPRNSVHVEYV